MATPFTFFIKMYDRRGGLRTPDPKTLVDCLLRIYFSRLNEGPIVSVLRMKLTLLLHSIVHCTKVQS